MHVIIVVLAYIFAQSLACHGAEEVSESHAYRLNGPWLIDRQTDDLNEWSERIKCLLSSPFIPFFPSIYLSLFPGEGLVVDGLCCEEVGPF